MALYELREGDIMTIKDLADELSVSKTAVNKKLAELNLKDHLQKQGNRFIVPGEVADQIRQAFSESKSKPADNGTGGVSVEQVLREQIADLKAHIEVLNHQLEVKDMQIERAQATNQYLLAGSVQSDLREVDDENITVTETETVSETVSVDEKRPGILARLFK